MAPQRFALGGHFSSAEKGLLDSGRATGATGCAARARRSSRRPAASRAAGGTASGRTAGGGAAISAGASLAGRARTAATRTAPLVGTATGESGE